MNNLWTLGNPIASLFTRHRGCLLWSVLLNISLWSTKTTAGHHIRMATQISYKIPLADHTNDIGDQEVPDNHRVLGKLSNKNKDEHSHGGYIKHGWHGEDYA